MEPFSTITSTVLPVPLKDVDTDQIIPAKYLTSTSRDGFAEGLFANYREQDPNFPMNLEVFKSAQILCADNNFGCGSSREHAVWALLGWGINVVLAPSFADIFFSNSAKNGLLLVQLPDTTIQEILDKSKDGAYNVTVDLEQQRVHLPNDEDIRFEYDPFRKECLLQGYDDLDYILSHKQEIEQYAERREKELFYTTGVMNHS